MMVDYSGPEIGEADKMLIEALHIHSKDNTKGILFYTKNIFRSNGKTVEKIVSTKSLLPLYK